MIALAGVLLASAAIAQTAPAPPTTPPPMFPPFGIDLSAGDSSVRPGDDFFAYANGGWLARTAIPADASSVTMGRMTVDRVEARLHTLLDAAAHGVAVQPADVTGKVGAMYAAFMDTARIEALGATPIRPAIDAVAAATDRHALATLMGRSPYDFGTAPFALGIDVDLKDPAVYAVYVDQAGLGLPDRDYSLAPGFKTEREAYRTYARTLLQLIGWPDPAGSADAILALETRIAQASWTKAQERDPVAIYNPMTPAEIAAFAPGFDWPAFLASAGVGARDRLIVGPRTAFPGIAAAVGEAPVATLKAWLAFHVTDSAAAYLSSPFQTASFEFHEHALSGQSKQSPRWKRAVRAVAGGDCGGEPATCFGTLNWAVGQIYVAADFRPETRAKVQALVANLMAAYHARIEKLDWMGPATRAEALKKLDTYTVKVGYPDHPRDYSGVVIRSDDLVGDVRRAARADWDFQVRRSVGPVDRSDWQMTPQTVDAYNGSLRDIVFPAGILQAPIFDPAADDAVNYGAIGAVIGHELTHGFDDQGRLIDAAGALRDWWTPDDARQFKQRAARLGAEFAAFEPVPGLHINPDLTMGENIADLGGMVVALDAYHRSLAGHPAPVIGGLTGDQRFFLSYAQVWRGKARDDAIRQQTTSDPHSYRRYRVLGPIPNVDSWYAAFDVKPGDKMYRVPEDRVRIW
jgi:putative endopeptidase